MHPFLFVPRLLYRDIRFCSFLVYFIGTSVSVRSSFTLSGHPFLFVPRLLYRDILVIAFLFVQQPWTYELLTTVDIRIVNNRKHMNC